MKNLWTNTLRAAETAITIGFWVAGFSDNNLYKSAIFFILGFLTGAIGICLSLEAARTIKASACFGLAFVFLMTDFWVYHQASDTTFQCPPGTAICDDGGTNNTYSGNQFINMPHGIIEHGTHGDKAQGNKFLCSIGLLCGSD